MGDDEILYLKSPLSVFTAKHYYVLNYTGLKLINYYVMYITSDSQYMETVLLIALYLLLDVLIKDMMIMMMKMMMMMTTL